MKKLIIGNVVKWNAVAKQAFAGCPGDIDGGDDLDGCEMDD